MTNPEQAPVKVYLNTAFDKTERKRSFTVSGVTRAVRDWQNQPLLPQHVEIRYSRDALDGDGPFTVGVVVTGRNLRADGTIGVRHRSAQFLYRPGEHDPEHTWPEWLYALVAANHPDNDVVSDEAPAPVAESSP